MARFGSKLKKKKTGSQNIDRQGQWHRAWGRAVEPPISQMLANRGSIPETL